MGACSPSLTGRRAPERRFYDITEAINKVEFLTLASAQAAMRERWRRDRPPSGAAASCTCERVPRFSAPRRGSVQQAAADRRWRSAWLQCLGARIRANMFGNKLFVEPVNADAYQAVALSAYVINRDLEDAWRRARTPAARSVLLNCPAWGRPSHLLQGRSGDRRGPALRLDAV